MNCNDRNAKQKLNQKTISAKHGLVNGNGFTNGIASGSKRNGKIGLTNGLGRVNGNGFTNGLTNGVGRVNGNGFVNGLTNGVGRGNGFVNGKGLVNGTRTRLRSNIFGVVTQKDLRVGISLTVLFVLLLPSFYLIFSTPVPSPPRITIDGNFSDWQDIPHYQDQISGPNSNITFTEYSLMEEGGMICVSVRVRGQIFSETQGYDGFYAFIDADGDSTTGYWPGDLGAEYVALIDGGNYQILKAEIMKFNYFGDSLNWSDWHLFSSMSAAFSGNSIEFAIPSNLMNLDDNYTLRLLATDYQGNIALSSLRIGREYGALLIEQSPVNELSPITPMNSEILHLRIVSYGKKIEIPDFSTRTHWQIYPTDLKDYIQLPNIVNLEADQEVHFNVSVILSGYPAETLLWLNLTGIDLDMPVTIIGMGSAAYVERVPQLKKVDGWFGDWQQDIENDYGAPVANPNIDIKSYSSNLTDYGGGKDILFFVEFRGKAMAGASAPVEVRWIDYPGPPQPSPGPVKPKKRVAGEDILTFYIDTNSSDMGGCPTHGVLANYRLEIIGHMHKVESKTLYECSNGNWYPLLSVPLFAISSGSKIEASINVAYLGILENTEILVESTDWSGVNDVPLPIGIGTRSDGLNRRTRSEEFPVVLDTAPGLQQITSRQLSSDPNLDGQCDDTEYLNEATHVTNVSYEFYIGHTNNWVWVCIIVYDPTDEFEDHAEIVFDSNHNHTSSPQIDDRRYNLTAGSNMMTRQRGDGTTWVPCGGQCFGGDQGQGLFANNNQTYEFRINPLNVWSPLNPSGRAGFAIHMFDRNGMVPRNYYWGSWIVDVNNPDTWGHLDIPEFYYLMLPTIFAIILPYIRRRGRRA